MKESAQILIGGDTVITESLDVEKLIDKELKLYFREADLSILNLEAPVTNSTNKILKTGPHLKAHSSSTLEFFQQLETDVVTLANNHVLDYDSIGLEDTLQFCLDNQIRTVGAGMDLEKAIKPLYCETKAGKICVLNIAENEWASAEREKAGAHPMDVIDNFHQIKNAKDKADYVFVIIHGGHEYYELPSPRIQKLYRFFADQGADLVVSHHTHCISGYEIYNGVPIYYGLGNFFFTSNNQTKQWNTGLVLDVKIKGGKVNSSVEFVRYNTSANRLNLLSSGEREVEQKHVDSINEIIADPRLLHQAWENYIDKSYMGFLPYFSPSAHIKNRYLRGALKKMRILGITKYGMALRLNLMRCESHLDLSKKMAKKFLKL